MRTTGASICRRHQQVGALVESSSCPSSTDIRLGALLLSRQRLCHHRFLVTLVSHCRGRNRTLEDVSGPDRSFELVSSTLDTVEKISVADLAPPPAAHRLRPAARDFLQSRPNDRVRQPALGRIRPAPSRAKMIEPANQDGGDRHPGAAGQDELVGRRTKKQRPSRSRETTLIGINSSIIR